MTRFSIARRGVVLTLLAALISVPTVVVAAAPASAAACHGKITNHASSRDRSIVGYFYNNSSSNILYPGYTATGNASHIITRFSTPIDRAVDIAYYDLANNNKYITTHPLDAGGLFNINPCHWGVVKVW